MSANRHRNSRLEKSISVIVLFLGLFRMVSWAMADQEGDWTYTTEGTNVTLWGYTGTNGVVVIPDTISGLSVISVGGSAFQGNNMLTDITIPDCIISIRSSAFSLCSNLKSVTMGIKVAILEANAFAFCIKLTDITIPDSVTNINYLAFYGCLNLTAITVDKGNPAYSSVDGVLFNKSQTTLIQHPGGNVGAYTIPNTVSNIGSCAFAYNLGLTNLTIPASVLSIGNSAFVQCSYLAAITVDKGNPSYSSVDEVLFNKSQTTIIQYPCGKAGDFTVSSTVANIGDSAFSYCKALTSVYFRGEAPHLGTKVFNGDNNLTIYYYPWTSGWTDTYGGRPTQVNPAYTQWLLDHSFATNRTEDSTDYDNDGMKNWQEFLAHTDPKTNIDCLAIISVGSETNQSQISWSAKSNVTYQVMKSDDLMVAWSNAPSGIGGNQQSYQTAPVDGLLQYADPNVSGSTNAFYRVNVVQ